MLRFSILSLWVSCIPCYGEDPKLETPKKPSTKVVLQYSGHIEEKGESKFVMQPEKCGTEGESRTLEGITIRLAPKSEKIKLRYKVHLQDYGDTGWFGLGEFAGTRLQYRRLEAIWIEILGEGAKTYDIYYQAHLAGDGWTDWKTNGEMCGSRRQGKRLEAIRIFAVEK